METQVDGEPFTGANGTVVAGVAAFATTVDRADDAELLVRLDDVEERRRALEAETALVVEALERRTVHRVDQHATMYGLLRSRVGWSDRECRERLRLGRLLSTFADAAELLHDARVSVANVTEVARAHANPRCGERLEYEVGALLGAACRLEHHDLRAHVVAWEQRVDRGSETAAARRHEQRDARLVNRRDGARLEAAWGELDGLSNREIFDRFVHMEWETDWAHAVEQWGAEAAPNCLPRTAAQRRADALTAIFERAASAPPGSRAPEPSVVIHVDHHTAADILGEMDLFPERDVDPFEEGPPATTDRRCATTNGHPVDPRTAMRVALHGHVRWAIANERGVPVTWGRRRRLFGGQAAHAVRSLSSRCTFPGCRVVAGRCQLDHIRPFAAGGPTDPDNGAPMCPRHNRVKNRGYTTWRDPSGGWHAYRPDGSELPWS